MKAIICDRYGNPDKLKLTEVEKPIPKSDEVLIKIYATAVNDYDWSMIRGEPYIYRLMYGLIKPKRKIPGMELSGVIEEIGPKVSLFNIGDEVYGDISEYGFGSFAQYVAINEKAIVNKPKSMSFEDAAAIPHASMLALQGLLDIGSIKKKMKILINGAGGGVGTFGLQIAKHYNAEVTGADTGDKLQTMSSIGFDHIIDYKEVDFTRNGESYDLILDAKTYRSPFSYLRSLKKNGKYVTVGGNLPRLLQAVILKGLIRKIYKKEIHIVALKANKDLDYINELYASGKIKPTIDGSYKLIDTPGAIEHFGKGLHKGKVIINVV